MDLFYFSVFEVHYITVISGFAGVLKSLCPVLTPKVNLTGFVFYAYISGSDHGARSGYFRPQIHFFFKIDFWAWESPPPPLIQVVVKLGGINLWKGLHFFEKHPLYRVVSYTDIGKFLSLREKIFRVATSFFVLCQKVTASRNDYSRHRRRKRPRGILEFTNFFLSWGDPCGFSGLVWDVMRYGESNFARRKKIFWACQSNASRLAIIFQLWLDILLLHAFGHKVRDGCSYWRKRRGGKKLINHEWRTDVSLGAKKIPVSPFRKIFIPTHFSPPSTLAVLNFQCASLKGLSDWWIVLSPYSDMRGHWKRKKRPWSSPSSSLLGVVDFFLKGHLHETCRSRFEEISAFNLLKVASVKFKISRKLYLQNIFHIFLFSMFLPLLRSGALLLFHGVFPLQLV